MCPHSSSFSWHESNILLVCLGRSMDLYEEGKQDMCSDGPFNTLKNNSTSNRDGCLKAKQIFQAMNHCHLLWILTEKCHKEPGYFGSSKYNTYSNSIFPKIVWKLKKKKAFFSFFPSKLAAVAVWSFGLLLCKKCSTFLTPSHLDH